MQGRHPLQTSDALGCCGSQLGPDAQAAAVYLNKHAGLSHGKVAHLFRGLFDVPLTAGGVSQVILRAGRRCEPDYQAILARVRLSKWAVPDETGWRVGGLPGWLHVAVTADAIAFGIFTGAGHRSLKPRPFRLRAGSLSPSQSCSPTSRWTNGLKHCPIFRSPKARSRSSAFSAG